MAALAALLQEVSARSTVVATWLTYVEDGIYPVTAALLGATAVVLNGAVRVDPVAASKAGTVTR
jgi:hypothetical protein